MPRRTLKECLLEGGVKGIEFHGEFPVQEFYEENGEHRSKIKYLHRNYEVTNIRREGNHVMMDLKFKEKDEIRNQPFFNIIDHLNDLEPIEKESVIEWYIPQLIL